MTPRKNIDSNESVKRLVRRLHPSMDVDAVFDQLLFSADSGCRISDLPLSLLEKHFPKHTAELIGMIPGMARKTLRNQLPEHPQFRYFHQALPILNSYFLGQYYEHCYVFLLRRTGYLISAELVQRGTTDRVPFFVRNIVELLLGSGADALVIAHNHPGGSLNPSNADIESTLSLIQALAPLQIPLIDHLIYSNWNCMSIRESGGVPETIWNAQPGNCAALMQHWLDKQNIKR